MNPIIGVKAYGWDWSSTHRLSMRQAAEKMVAHGIDWALVQNLIDPLPGSAVDQAPPAGAYNDREWVKTLQETGLRVFQSTAVFFAPDDFKNDPSLRPVDQHGEVFEPFSWYVGICPTHPDYLARKINRFAQAVEATEPDGVFLSFLRFPGFWEMWLPETPRQSIREYCFCPRCLLQFSETCAIDLPEGGPVRWRAMIFHELRKEWTNWKCQWIGEVALRFRKAALAIKPSLECILNGFGLGSADFNNAVEEAIGQRFSELDCAITHYELMFYFQILKRDPATWIPPRIKEARAQTSRTILACLQGQAEYLEPLYDGGHRARTISASEWEDALRAVAASGADGVLTYSWRDLLADEASGGTRIRSLLSYKHQAFL